MPIYSIMAGLERAVSTLRASSRKERKDGIKDFLHFLSRRTKHSILKAFQLGFQGERKSLDKGLLTGLLWNPNSLQGSDKSSVGQGKRIEGRELKKAKVS